MKLYCVMVKFKNNNDVDVYHMLGNKPIDIHERMEKFQNECDRYDYPIESFRFHEVQNVDGFSKLNDFLSGYYIEDNKIKSL